MGTAIAVKKQDNHDVPVGSQLAVQEERLGDAMFECAEAFYRQGAILEEISTGGSFREAGYKSFSAYMNGRNPHGISNSYAWKLIAAKRVRKLLPDILSPIGDRVWTEWVIRPLTHKDFKSPDVRRIGKKIATCVRKGEALTDTLVKRICDDERGVVKQKAKRAVKKLETAETSVDVLRRLKVEADMWLESLVELPASFWNEAEEDSPGCTDSAIKALSKLVSFLRG